MQLNITIKGIERVKAQLEALSGGQARAAYAKALNDTGFQVRRDMQREITQRFDRPTPFIVRSPKVFPATADKLEVSIAPTYASQFGTKGGKIGVDPQQVLQAQEFGGQRRDKRSEVALRRAGILPNGMQLAIPATPFPGSEDGYGNLRGPFLVQLISYFQAFGEQGYRANMTDKTRANLGRGGAASRLAKVAGPQLGRRYIVSYGKARGGARMTRKGEADQRASNLAPGIWAVLGSTGATVKPVVMFVRKGVYKPRLDLDGLGKSAATQDYLARRMRFRIREAAGV